MLAYWNNQNISSAGKIILINSVLMAIPSYQLAVYPILDSVLDRLSNLARKSCGLKWQSKWHSSSLLGHYYT